MTGYDLLKNYIENPEALLRKKWSHATSSSATPLTVEPVIPTPSSTPTMAKTLRDYFTPAVANVPVGPAVNVGEGNFELRTGLITMLQESQFHGLPSEGANAHLQHFLELCDTIVIKVVAPESMRLRLFPFPLLEWFYKEKEVVNSWDYARPMPARLRIIPLSFLFILSFEVCQVCVHYLEYHRLYPYYKQLVYLQALLFKFISILDS
jgi:hypothetical protein